MFLNIRVTLQALNLFIYKGAVEEIVDDDRYIALFSLAPAATEVNRGTAVSA